MLSTSNDRGAERRPRPPGALGMLARSAVALAAFALVGVALRAVASPAGGGTVGAKVEYWRAHASEFDTVFVGSSHVHRGFVPEEFDRLLAAGGLECRSFNFGIQLPHLIEARHLIQEVLASGNVERVFLEYQSLVPQVDPENAFIPRSLYWHDGPGTALAVERCLAWGRALGDGFGFAEDRSEVHSIFVLAERFAVPPCWRASGEHVEHFLVNALLIGRGKDVVKGLLGREHGQTARVGASQGYLSLEEELADLAGRGEANAYARRRATFLAELERYSEEVAALEREPEVFGDQEWMNPELLRVDDLELLQRIAAEVQERGVQFVLVVMPSQSCNRAFEERLVEDLGARVLRYNRPDLYPELYAPENRFDAGHLSGQGALLFTRILAREYEDGGVQRREPPAPGCMTYEESVELDGTLEDAQ